MRSRLPLYTGQTVRARLWAMGARRAPLQTGLLGDPTPATKEKGDRILASLVSGWVRVIQDIYQFRQPQGN